MLIFGILTLYAAFGVPDLRNRYMSIALKKKTVKIYAVMYKHFSPNGNII